jgi:ribosomal protein S3
MQLTMDRGAQGIKIRIAGRLGGAEIARVESQLKGSIPLTTLTPTSTTASPRRAARTAASA